MLGRRAADAAETEHLVNEQLWSTVADLFFGDLHVVTKWLADLGRGLGEGEVQQAGVHDL